MTPNETAPMQGLADYLRGLATASETMSHKGWATLRRWADEVEAARAASPVMQNGPEGENLGHEFHRQLERLVAPVAAEQPAQGTGKSFTDVDAMFEEILAPAPISDERIDRFLADVDDFCKMPLYDEKFRGRARALTRALLAEAAPAAEPAQAARSNRAGEAGICCQEPQNCGQACVHRGEWIERQKGIALMAAAKKVAHTRANLGWCRETDDAIEALRRALGEQKP